MSIRPLRLVVVLGCLAVTFSACTQPGPTPTATTKPTLTPTSVVQPTATQEDRRFILKAVGATLVAHEDGTWELELQVPLENPEPVQIPDRTPGFPVRGYGGCPPVTKRYWAERAGKSGLPGTGERI